MCFFGRNGGSEWIWILVIIALIVCCSDTDCCDHHRDECC